MEDQDVPNNSWNCWFKNRAGINSHKAKPMTKNINIIVHNVSVLPLFTENCMSFIFKALLLHTSITLHQGITVIIPRQMWKVIPVIWNCWLRLALHSDKSHYTHCPTLKVKSRRWHYHLELSCPWILQATLLFFFSEGMVSPICLIAILNTLHSYSTLTLWIQTLTFPTQHSTTKTNDLKQTRWKNSDRNLTEHLCNDLHQSVKQDR